MKSRLTGRLTTVVSASILVGLTPLTSVSAEDWPQWGGPSRDNVSTETRWSPDGAPESAWQKNVGLGYSNVVIRDGRLWTMGYNEAEEKDYVYCLDAATGEEHWSYSYPAKKWDKFHGGGSNTTPVLDGDTLYVYNREGEYYSFNAATGDVNWKKNLKDDYGVVLPTWGFATTPLILNDMIVVNTGRAVAFDKKSGSMLWQSKDYGHAYSTPTAFEHDGKPHLALFAGYGLAVLDRSNGDEIAKYRWKTKYDVNAATPVVSGDRIFISSGYNHGCAMLQLKNGALDVLWENKKMRNHMTGCVLIDEHLYGFDESILKCMDMAGNVKWKVRGLGKGALTAAGNRLIIASSKGELVVAKASPESFEELSRTDVLDGGAYWTSPVISNGRIYIRSSKGEIACRDHRGDSAHP